MSEMTSRIRQGGHWRIAIRPLDFDVQRVDPASLRDIVVTRQVRLRGWYFPHIGPADLQEGEDWIGQESDSLNGAYLEAWRFFTSGQFAWMRSFRDEWTEARIELPRSGRPLPIYEVTNVLTETHEFAARLTLTDAGGEQMRVRVTVGGMADRFLTAGDPRRAPLNQPSPAQINEVFREKVLERADLLANSRERAIDMSQSLLQNIGWPRANRQILREIQTQVFGVEDPTNSV